MADDWTPGDLALCINDEFWSSEEDRMPPHICPKLGSEYLVTDVVIVDMWGKDEVAIHFPTFPNSAWTAANFVKAKPRGEDILREVKEPVDA